MEFEDLERVNSSLKTLNIKGKEYVMVNERVLAFRALYPEGKILNEILYDDGTRCTVKTTVKDGDQTIATAHASEVREGMVNKTNYLENCETSAVGRALGFLGIGSMSSIASAEEVTNAINQQYDNGSFIGACVECGQQYQFDNTAQLEQSMCICGCKKFVRV